MKLLRVEKDRYFFHLGRREKELFELMLRLYPVIPSADRSSNKTSRTPEQSQPLLDEALAEQRKENKQQVEAWLADGARFKESEKGFGLTLSAGEIEWVLQILNDVRVGNWILLGSPEEHPRLIPNAEMSPNVAMMEFAGIFQMDLLTAIEHNR
ncbi:MAG TPA: hypothetical protein VHC44_07110 [Verrucomicrobiae bacterium]|nr:hypothetical protein [Verrucomicrobiae bacterium]